MKKSELLKIINKYVGYAEQEIYDAVEDCLREAIKADRENVAKHAKWKSVPPRMTNMDGIEVNKNSIINAPEIELK